MLTLATWFYVGYIKDKLLENTPKDLESHDLNDRVTITLTRNAFGHGEPIPIWHAADGSNVSPPLSWYNLTSGTQSLVLMDDDYVTEIPMNHHGNYLTHLDVYHIPPVGIHCNLIPNWIKLTPTRILFPAQYRTKLEILLGKLFRKWNRVIRQPYSLLLDDPIEIAYIVFIPKVYPRS